MNTHIESTPIPSDAEILEAIRRRTFEIVILIRDVFVSPLDLFLLDRSHGILGTYWEVASDRYVSESISDALSTAGLPIGWTDWGTYYFLPALWMEDDSLATLRSMSEPEQFSALVKVKRALVDSEPSHVEELTRKFWVGMLGEPVKFKKGDMSRGDLNEGFGKVFLGERYLDRFGGDARALDRMIGPEFKLDDVIQQMDTLVSQLPDDLEDRHEEASGEYRVASAV